MESAGEFVELAIKVFEAGIVPRMGWYGDWYMVSWTTGEWIAFKAA